MTSRRAASIALVLLGCGAQGTPPRHESVQPSPPPPSSTAIAVEAPPPTELAPPPPPSDDVAVSVLVLPDDFEHVEIPSFRGSARAFEIEGEENADLRIPAFAHPDPAVRAALDAWIEDEVIHQFRDCNDPEIYMRCGVQLATEHLVSASCGMSGSQGRFGYDYGAFVISLAIDGTTLRRVQPEEAVLPSVDLRQLAHEACLVRSRADFAREPGEVPADERCGDVVVGFGPHGFSVMSWFYPVSATHTSIPYASLPDQLLADGPLGGLLAMASRHDIHMSADAMTDMTLARNCEVRWDLGPAQPIDELMRAYDRMPDDPAVPGAWAHDETGGGRLVSDACVTDHVALAAAEQAAQARATLLGGSATRSPHPTGDGAVWRGRVTDTLNVRSGPSTGDTVLATLSPGTDIVVATGAVDGHESSFGSRGRWLRMVSGDGTSGWVAASLVRRVETCPRPSFDAFFAAIPDASRREAQRTLERGMVVSPAPLRFVVARAAGHSWIATAAETDCEMATLTRLLEVEGRVSEVHFVPVARGSADAIVVVRAAAGPSDGPMRWSMFAPGATTPGWSFDEPGPSSSAASPVRIELGVQSGRDVWHVEVHPAHGRVQRVRWDGSAFVVR